MKQFHFPSLHTRQFVNSCVLALLPALAGCSSGYQVVLNDNVLYSPYETSSTPSIVNDANLQGCLNQQLTGNNPKDPEDITLVACPAAGVQSLAGIGALPNLEQLELSDNTISDLTQLTSLKKLRVLSIRNNRITNIAPLLSLPLLRFVALQGNNNISCDQLQALQEKLGNTLNRPDSCSN